MKARVGLLGGTFDPVHNGHLQIAEIAKRFCDLQEVWFIPAAVPPHKNCKAVASFTHRANMIQLALADRPDFKLSTIEASLPEPSYTIDTLRYLHAHAAVPTDFFFIIGTDAFFDIMTWKSYRQVLGAAHFVVLERAGCASGELKGLIEKLGYEAEGTHLVWYHPVLQKKIYSPSGSITDISSSTIRQHLKAHKPVAGLVPDDVIDYIHKNVIYV